MLQHPWFRLPRGSTLFAVFRGHQTGLFESYDDERAQLRGHSGGKFNGYPSREYSSAALVNWTAALQLFSEVLQLPESPSASAHGICWLGLPSIWKGLLRWLCAYTWNSRNRAGGTVWAIATAARGFAIKILFLFDVSSSNSYRAVEFSALDIHLCSAVLLSKFRQHALSNYL